MRFLDHLIAQRTDSDATLAEVLAPDGTVARSYSYGEILDAAASLRARLAFLRDGAHVGVLLGNSPEWLAADLALLGSALVEVPVPLAFSAEQAAGLLGDAAACLVDADGAARLAEWRGERVLPPACPLFDVDVDELATAPRPTAPPTPSAITVCKVVHTSGTTSLPKGVLIRREGLDDLIGSLSRHVDDAVFARYLSVVPLSLLIEQVTSAYMVMRAGGTVVYLPPREPLLGTARAAPSRLLRLMRLVAPTSLVVPPLLVEAIAGLLERRPGISAREIFGREEPPFLACGGAPVAPDVLARLDAAGVPVYEGYGLSENSSVVAWNTPAQRRLGTVGRPLDHVEVRVARDGELLVRSTSLFAGYTRSDPSSCVVDGDGWLHTGDLGAVDADGYLRILGRKKNVIITSSGRNVAPEWVESQYARLDAVEAAVVVGDGDDALAGLFVIADGYDAATAAAQVRAFGREHLSEVERVARLCLVPSGGDVRARHFTVTGRPARSRITRLLSSLFTGDEHTKHARGT